MKKHDRISLIKYWTTRYVFTIVIGLIIIGFISVLWIRHTTLENRLDVTRLLAEETADRVVNSDGKIIFGSVLSRVIDERQRLLDIEEDLIVMIVNKDGKVLFSKPPRLFLKKQVPIPTTYLDNDEEWQRLRLNDSERLYLVKAPIEFGETVSGWVVILQPESQLTKVDQEYRLLAVMLVSLGLLGWGVVYFLSKKLVQPIKEVASAARKIQAGDYRVKLPDKVKEQEVYELIHSFKEMSTRLEQLETMRAELLAGVTHELKTPVASISGINQALKDEVVSGEEAKELLEISVKEGQRLEKMIKDLLEFNSFAAGAIQLQPSEYEIGSLLKEITHQWRILHDREGVTLKVNLPDRPVLVTVDSIRLQQILINLLNNAEQALENSGDISVNAFIQSDQELAIEVKDTGKGIPAADQPLIFERFYRGENKKHTVRGLGIGLPFSQMLARALGGDLILKESSPSGSIFQVKLPITKG